MPHSDAGDSCRILVKQYSSSLRYYPDHRVAIAFQINTDVGIVDRT
jgi:hypothetical protein